MRIADFISRGSKTPIIPPPKPDASRFYSQLNLPSCVVLKKARLCVCTMYAMTSMLTKGCHYRRLLRLQQGLYLLSPSPPLPVVHLRPCLLLRYFHPRKMWEYMGIWCSPNTLKSPHILFPKNTLLWWKVFYLAKNTLEWRGFVGISRDYLLKTWTSKQTIGEILGYEIIPSHPL
jgi:hypothetical protein